MRASLRSWAVVLALASPWACAFEFGTSQPEDTLAGRLQRRIYHEAFRRLGLPLTFSVMPLQRLSAEADQGQVDGEVARVPGYAADHPSLVRVEEPVYDITWSLFATNPTLRLPQLSALAGTSWRATYLRGVAICANALKALLPPDRLIDVSSDAQGFSMLRLGRSEVHCTADLSAVTLQHSPDFKGVNILQRVADIGSFPLHPYLHRRHAELAPRLAAVLRHMKAEGLIERYRAESVREIENP
jgi:polar amino acid transport system substrate-binding protein